MNKNITSLKFGTQIKNEHCIARFIPYNTLADDETLTADNNSYLRIITFNNGFFHELASSKEVDAFSERMRLLLRTISSPTVGIWHTLTREKVKISNQPKAKSKFALDLQSDYYTSLKSKDFYLNTHYISVIVKPSSDKVLRFAERLKHISYLINQRQSQEAKKAALEELNSVVNRILEAFGDTSPRVLSTIENKHGCISEPLSFVSFLINGQRSDVYLSRTLLKYKLPTSRLIFSRNTCKISGVGFDRYCAALSIREFDNDMRPDDLDDLLVLPCEFVLTQSYAFITKAEAQSATELQEKLLIQSEDRGVSEIDALQTAIDQIVTGNIVMGEHHFCLMVYAESETLLKQSLSKASSALSNARLIPSRDDIVLEANYWSQLPANWAYRTRVNKLTSENFSCYCSLHNYPSGQVNGNYWGKSVCVLRGPSGTPYHFNFHSADVGNTIIIGRTGSGKTVVIDFLNAMLDKFGVKRIFFDKDRGTEIFIRAMAGSYHVLQPGRPSGFNPFQLPDTAQNRSFLTELLGYILGDENGNLHQDDIKQVSDLIDICYTLNKEHRVLSQLAGSLPQGANNHLAVKLSQWVDGGSYAWLFDNPREEIKFEDVNIGFDLTEILDIAILRSAALRYMAYRVDQMLDGRRTVISIDEGWKGLSDPYFSKMVFDWEKTIRKKEGFVIFGTNSAADCVATETGKVVIEQSPTKIFMPNPGAKREDYIEPFSLTEDEFNKIVSIPVHSRSFLLKHDTTSTVVNLDLSDLPDYMPVLSARTSNVELMDKIIASKGSDDPDHWLGEFLRQALLTREH